MTAKTKTKKTGMKTIISNISFIFRYIYAMDRKTVLLAIVIYTFAGIIYAVYDALFLKVLIEFFMEEDSALGSSEGTARLNRAIALADFQNKTESLKNGTDTILTKEFDDNGTLLSGGEAYKIAIARMFAKSGHSHIFILDELSSSLDTYAETKLNDNMLDYSVDATAILISHRLSTTKAVDRIYLLEDGIILEGGTHDELIKINGCYADSITNRLFTIKKTTQRIAFDYKCI